MPEAVAVGSEVAGYRLDRLIAQGGAALVFLAEEVATGDRVVLKVLRQELVGDEGLRRRFLRESRYASSLDHPHIVDVYDSGEAEGHLYIAMQYVAGTDLHDLLEDEGWLQPDRAVALLSQVASALDAAHEAGLIHRDVKPPNVLIETGPTGQPSKCYLTDFGLSKDPTRDSGALTGTDAFVGTIEYTAPEHMLSRELDRRVDVYSLGCVLYESLTGEPPFGSRSELELMQAHIQDPPPKATKARRDLPGELNGVIATALAKDPEDRYGSCGELVRAAAAALGVEPPPVATAPVPESLSLRVTGGRATGKEIPLTGELLIGRHQDGDGSLGGDPEVSGQHARIAREGDGPWLIADLGSRNGTFLNGRPIGGPSPLTVGDTIEVGGTSLVVEEGGAPVPTPAVAGPEPEPYRAATPTLRLELEIDPGAGTGLLRIGDGEEVELVVEGGRVRIAPPGPAGRRGS